MMVIVNNPGSWSAVYSPLLHAEWNGCTPTDLVFPFFIFIVGIAIPLAIPNQVFNTKNLIKIIIRSLRIICLGIFLNFFSKIYFLELNGIPLLLFRLLLTIIIGYALMGSYNEKWKMYVALFIFSLFMILAFGTEEFSNVRLPGVLQRIGIVYFFSSLVYLLSTIRTQIIIASVILLGYWATMTLIPVPGIGAANLERGTNFSAWIDHIVLGNHVYSATKTWDPEGLFSTLPAIAHGILGLYIGQLLLKENSKLEIVKKIISSGILFTFLGIIWSLVYPINKSLWSSSYVLYTAGLASLFLGFLYYCIDFKNFKKGLTPLVIWGVNPMIIFFLSGIIPRVLWMIEWENPEKASEKINLQRFLYHNCIEPYFGDPMLASLVGALTYTAILFGLLAVFYKNKLIFKV
jgi:predicted acyltransferase